MDDSDLILSLDQLATWANQSGFIDVEQFWTSLSALVATRQSQMKQARSKTAALMFQIAPKVFQQWIEAEVKKRGVDVLDIVVATILGAQMKGDIDQARSEMLVRIINDVRAKNR